MVLPDFINNQFFWRPEPHSHYSHDVTGAGNFLILQGDGPSASSKCPSDAGSANNFNIQFQRINP